MSLSCDVYEPAGYKGPKKVPIIVGHALGWNKFIYRHVAQALSNETGREVFTVDGTDHGQVEAGALNTAILDGAIQDVVYFMKEKGIKTANLVCHSIACVFAHVFAVDKPNLVDKIVMVDHLPYDNVPLHGDLMTKYLSYQNRLLMLLNKDMSLKAAQDKIISFAPADRKGVVALHEKIACDLTKTGDLFAWKHSIESQVRERIGRDSTEFGNRPSEVYHGEILVIRCENSEFVSDEAFKDALEYNPKMKLLTIKDATHLLMFEKTEEFIEEVKKFLDGNDANEDV